MAPHHLLTALLPFQTEPSLCRPHYHILQLELWRVFIDPHEHGPYSACAFHALLLISRDPGDRAPNCVPISAHVPYYAPSYFKTPS